jgi:hypothetical protein
MVLTSNSEDLVGSPRIGTLRIWSGYKKNVIKIVHNRMVCNEREHRYYEYKPEVCYECKNEVEGHSQILTCKKCVQRLNLRKKYIYDIKNKLITLGTNNDTIRALIYSLQSWLDGTSVVATKEIAPNASRLLK